MESTRCVDDQDICSLRNCGMNSVITYSSRIGSFFMRDNVSICHVTPCSQLLDCCRTESIRRREHDFLTLVLITEAEFTGSCGLTCSVNTDHQDDIQVVIFNIECFLLTEDIEHLGAYDTNDCVFTVITGLLNGISYFIHDLKAGSDTAVGLNQKSLEVIEHIFIKTAHRRGDLSNTLRYEVSRLLKTFFKYIKQSHKVLLILSLTDFIIPFGIYEIRQLHQVSLRRIDKILEIPLSCIVTPYIRSQASIVPFLWVTRMNWDFTQ